MSRSHRPKPGHPYITGSAFNQSSPIDTDPVPCFNFEACGNYSVVCKSGKSFCRPCADKVCGIEYPVRVPLESADLRKIEASLSMGSAYPAV